MRYAETNLLRFALLFAVPSILFCGCATGHEDREVVGGCPALYEWERDDAELKTRLLSAQSTQDLDAIFGQPCAASCVDSRGVEWRFWYAKQEWPQNLRWHWRHYLMAVTLRDGRVCGFMDPENPTGVIGDLVWNDDSLWCYTRNVMPHFTEHYDHLVENKYFFNDALRCYVKDSRRKVVDHWEGSNVVWKLPPVKIGHMRLFETNALGKVVYYDLRPGWTYKGFNRETGVFNVDPPPCGPGLRRVWHGDKFCDIPSDAIYLGYDGSFQYRTREQEVARLRKQAEDDALIAGAVASGLNAALQPIMTINRPATATAMTPIVTTSNQGSQTKQVQGKSSVVLAAPARPRCEKHDCERDALGHCPVCNSGYLKRLKEDHVD